MTTSLLDVDNPINNMYGCAPCPKCQSKYRWPMNNEHNGPENGQIICDDCGYLEPWTTKETIKQITKELRHELPK
jgi:Zn ribbon nucleic-acid-binding protein